MVSRAVLTVSCFACAAAAQVNPAFFSGLSWRNVGPLTGGHITAVSGVAGVSGEYIVFSATGGNWETRDGGQSWHPFTGTAPAATPRWVDPDNAKRIVEASASGARVTLDGGAIWSNWGNLPIAEMDRLPADSGAPAAAPFAALLDKARHTLGASVHAVAEDPHKPELLFAGDDTGVSVSFDDGAHWQPLHLNMPAVSVRDVAVRGNHLFAATWGRSEWQLDDITPLAQVSSATSATEPHLFQPPTAVRGVDTGSAVNLDYYLGRAAKSVTLEITDAAGKALRTMKSENAVADPWLRKMPALALTPGEHRVSWDLRLDPPPVPANQYVSAVPVLVRDSAPEPGGPLVLSGAYRLRLTVDGQVFTQPLTVTTGSAPAGAVADMQAEFSLESRIYEALNAAYAGHRRAEAVRSRVTEQKTSDANLQDTETQLLDRLHPLAAGGLDNGINLVALILDMPPDAVEDKDADVDQAAAAAGFAPPDHDDPSIVVGRTFVDAGAAATSTAPSFGNVATAMASLLQKVETGGAAGAVLQADTFNHLCVSLNAAWSDWHAVVTQDLAAWNSQISHAGLKPVVADDSPPPAACRQPAAQ